MGTKIRVTEIVDFLEWASMRVMGVPSQYHDHTHIYVSQSHIYEDCMMSDGLLSVFPYNFFAILETIFTRN